MHDGSNPPRHAGGIAHRARGRVRLGQALAARVPVACLQGAPSVPAALQFLGESAPGARREVVLAALNGVIGDYLEATASPLAIAMSLRPPIGALHRSGTLLVLVHGSCMCDLHWTRNGHDHGCALGQDLGWTPAYVHYNGRHVSANGKDLDHLLERESEGFSDIVVLGHSMGGLVARASSRAAEDARHAWRRKLRALGQIRSAGVTDLRFGNVVEADWRTRDRFAHGADPRTPTPLPQGVRCYAVADSALGEHPNAAFTLTFTDRHVVAASKHLDLLSSQEADEKSLLRGMLAGSMLGRLQTKMNTLRNCLAASYAFVLACGDGAPDASNLDTHTLEVSVIEKSDGTSETIITDLGIVPEHQAPLLEEDGSEIGVLEQALTVSGRHGMDSAKAPDATDSRCPNNGYTVGPNSCQVPGTKIFYWENAMGTAWDATFGQEFADLWSAARAGANGWSFGHNQFQSGTTPPANGSIRFGDDVTFCGMTALGCAKIQYGPVVLYQGKRYRKSVTTTQGFYAIIYLDPQTWYDTGEIQDDMSRTAKDSVAYNIMLHELGHTMGLGHNPTTEGTSTLSVMGPTQEFVQTFHNAEKSQLRTYQP